MHKRQLPAFTTITWPEIYEPRQPNSTQQLPHPSRHFYHLLYSIGLRVTYDARIAHFMEKLCNHIIVRLYLGREQRCTNKILEYINNAMQELQHQEGLRVDFGEREKQQVRLDDREHRHRWGSAREI